MNKKYTTPETRLHALACSIFCSMQQGSGDYQDGMDVDSKRRGGNKIDDKEISILTENNTSLW